MDVPITKPSMVSYADELDFNDLRMDLGKEKKNGFIRVTSGSREGCILYQNGKEVAASCENLSKIEALSEIIEDIKEPNTLIEVFNVSPSQVKYLIDLNKFFLFDKEIDPVEELKVVEKVETQVKTEKEPVVQPKGETEPVTEAQRKTEPQVTQTKVESNVKDETEVEAEVRPQTEVETEVKPQTEVETEIKPQTEVKSEVKPITDAEVNPVPETVPQKEAKTDSKTTITAKSQVETQPEPLPQIKPIRANEPKAQPGSEAKSLEEPIATDKPQVETKPETEPLEEIKPSEEPKVEEKPEVEIQGELVDARPIKKPKPEVAKPTNKVVETKVEYVSEVKPPTQGKPVTKSENDVKGEESPQEVVESYIKYQSEQQAEGASLTAESESKITDSAREPVSEVTPSASESESEVTPSPGEPVSEVTPSVSESKSEVAPSPGELESEVTPKSSEESVTEGDGEPQTKVEPNSEVAPVEETETEPEREEEPVSRDELMSKFGIKEPEEEDVESFIESYSGGIVSDEDLPNIEFTLTNKIRKSVLGIPKINAAQVNLILDNSKGLEGTINIVAEYEAKGFLSGLRRASKEETFTEQITYATVIEIRKIFREYPEVLDYFEINVSFS